MDMWQKLFLVLEKRERRRFIVLSGLIVLAAIAEMMSLAAVMFYFIP